MREDLARYQAAKPCPHATARGCGARRATCSCSRAADGEHDADADLRGRARHAGRGLAYFETLQLDGAKAEIADKVVREIRSRLKFLNDVGLTT